MGDDASDGGEEVGGEEGDRLPTDIPELKTYGYACG
jgi:hypothetical protein